MRESPQTHISSGEMMFPATETMQQDAKTDLNDAPQAPAYFMVLGSWLSRLFREQMNTCPTAQSVKRLEPLSGQRSKIECDAVKSRAADHESTERFDHAVRYTMTGSDIHRRIATSAAQLAQVARCTDSRKARV